MRRLNSLKLSSEDDQISNVLIYNIPIFTFDIDIYVWLMLTDEGIFSVGVQVYAADWKSLFSYNYWTFDVKLADGWWDAHKRTSRMKNAECGLKSRLFLRILLFVFVYEIKSIRFRFVGVRFESRTTFCVEECS